MFFSIRNQSDFLIVFKQVQLSARGAAAVLTLHDEILVCVLSSQCSLYLSM
jgi:hypothetical protein